MWTSASGQKLLLLIKKFQTLCGNSWTSCWTPPSCVLLLYLGKELPTDDSCTLLHPSNTSTKEVWAEPSVCRDCVWVPTHSLATAAGGDDQWCCTAGLYVFINVLSLMLTQSMGHVYPRDTACGCKWDLPSESSTFLHSAPFFEFMVLVNYQSLTVIKSTQLIYQMLQRKISKCFTKQHESLLFL